MPEPAPGAVEAFRRKHDLVASDGTPRPTIGLASRLAAEKGVETVLAAAEHLLPEFPDLRILFAGPYENLVGEQEYRERLTPAIERLGRRWTFLGPLDPAAEMPTFFGALDCLVVSSVNSTESFGLVQVEAMLCGTPVVASDLPGVREPVRITRMGEIVAPRDPAALAAALGRVIGKRDSYVRTRSEVHDIFDPQRTLDRYEALFHDSLAARRRRRRGARTGT